MEIATFVVAVVAALISGGALIYTFRADGRAVKNEDRLTAQEQREEHREQREEVAALLAQTAILHADYLGGGQSSLRSYRFRARNTGRQAASHLNAQLIDAQGNRVSDPSAPTATSILAPGESGGFEVAVYPDALDRNPLFLLFTWWDTGPHQRSYLSKVEVPEI